MDFDDDYEAVAAATHTHAHGGHKGHGGDEDEEEWVLTVADKPGFDTWKSALNTRVSRSHTQVSWGRWLPDEGVVECVRVRGRKLQSMGFHRDGSLILAPHEALYLIDDGLLRLIEPLDWDVLEGEGGGEEEGESAEATAAVEDTPMQMHTGMEGRADSAGAASAGATAGKQREPRFLPLEIAYSMVAAHVDMPAFHVYSHLRTLGLVVCTHVWERETPEMERVHLLRALVESEASAQMASQAGAQCEWPREGELVLREEAPLAVQFDVYARDGFSSFKPSAPGPPDFYIVLARASDPPPSPSQLANLRERLRNHMAALASTQRRRLGDKLLMPVDTSSAEPLIKIAVAQHTTVSYYSVSETFVRANH